MIGSRQRVLVDGSARRDNAELAARTTNNRVVNFTGSRDLIGQFADVAITGAMAHTLRGELLTADCVAH